MNLPSMIFWTRWLRFAMWAAPTDHEHDAGMGKMKVPNQELDQKRMARMEAVVRSMTEQERLRPEIINASRKRRIARGCGQQVSDVNRLLNQYESIRKMVRMMKGGRKGGFKLPF